MADTISEAKQRLEEARKSYAKGLTQLSEAGCDVDALMEAECAEAERLRAELDTERQISAGHRKSIVEVCAEVDALRAALAVFADGRNWRSWDRRLQRYAWMPDGEPWTIAQEALEKKAG